MTPLTAFNLCALALFCMGLYGVLARKNLIAMLIGVELMLNAASLNALAWGRYGLVDPAHAAVSGQILVLFIIGLAAAEAAIALAIILAVHRHRHSVDVDDLDTLEG